ncbi:hypothetical protein AB5J72_00935 [Streptomyces sp. CG1]|uniref:hypothetical protein n=1 Tax=Streptomyces sp. CG1 TaxID=1287523 RepID=UPI0034E24A3B
MVEGDCSRRRGSDSRLRRVKIRHAANPRNIELTDLPDLADAIFDLYNDSQKAAKNLR